MKKSQGFRRKPRKIKKKKTIWRSQGFWVGIGCLIVLAGTFYALIFSSIFQIKDIMVAAPMGMPVDMFKDIASAKITQKLLFLPTKSIFLASIKEIQQAVLEKFVQIDRVKVKRRLPDLLVVEIRNRLAVAQWCQTQEEIQEEGPDNLDEQKECFFIDRKGIVFDEEFATQEAPKLVIGSDGELFGEPGKQVIEEGEMAVILQIQKELRQDVQIAVEEFVVASDRLIAKVDVAGGPTRNATSTRNMAGGAIYFDLEGDISDQLFNLKVLLEEQVNLEERKIEYIDLRFGNRIYYK